MAKARFKPMNAGHHTGLFLCLISVLTARRQGFNIASVVIMGTSGMNPGIVAAEWTIGYDNSK